MMHTCFHARADHHDQIATSIEEAKKLVDEWVDEGDSHLKIYKISADEIADYINVDEELIYLDNIH